MEGQAASSSHFWEHGQFLGMNDFLNKMPKMFWAANLQPLQFKVLLLYSYTPRNMNETWSHKLDSSVMQ